MLQDQPAASNRRLAADLGYRVMTMQASPSSLQQPSKRHARWHVPEASLKVCISFRKVLSAAGGAPQVCSLFTATCQASQQFSLASTGTVCFLYRGALTFMVWSPSFRSALYKVTPGEPRANTGPRVTADAAIVYRESADMLPNSTLRSSQSLLLRLGTAWLCWTSMVSIQAVCRSATTVSGRFGSVFGIDAST